mmetsp:Transcript_25931/g.66858  ORF Transcript_25931/g.66858 Transcript_25931/m.66858 type:complete len:234 (-) Transcript_25931:391-1092(-)
MRSCDSASTVPQAAFSGVARLTASGVACSTCSMSVNNLAGASCSLRGAACCPCCCSSTSSLAAACAPAAAAAAAASPGCSAMAPTPSLLAAHSCSCFSSALSAGAAACSWPVVALDLLTLGGEGGSAELPRRSKLCCASSKLCSRVRASGAGRGEPWLCAAGFCKAEGEQSSSVEWKLLRPDQHCASSALPLSAGPISPLSLEHPSCCCCCCVFRSPWSLLLCCWSSFALHVS